MKKSVSFLLCFIITFSLVSCLFEPGSLDDTAVNTPAPDDTADNAGSTMETQRKPTDEPTEIIENTKYYKIEKLLLTTVRYSIYDSNGTVVLCEETDRPLQISMLNEDVVDICIGMGTGISVHKYYDVQSNRFSKEYNDVVATSNNLVAYIDTSMDEPWFNRRLVIRDIFHETVFCKSFFLYFSVNEHSPIQSARFTEEEEELEVVYLIGTPSVRQSVTLPIRRAVLPEDLLRESEKAMEAYEAALRNEIKVYETDIGTFNYLMNCKTPYNRISLNDMNDLKYVYMDTDGDTVNELVIDCGDTLILRYYKGIVYVYPFTFRNMYHLNIDGSYTWNYNGQNFEYGEKQLAFDGTELKTTELWRIVNDGEPNAEYYIGGERVSLEVLLKHFEDNPKTRVNFIPLELSLENAISREEAVKIADEYWGYVDGETDGACGTTSLSRIVVSNEPNPICPYYRIAWQIEHYYNSEVEGYEDGRPYLIKIYKEVLVNIYTGECVPYFVSEGK